MEYGNSLTYSEAIFHQNRNKNTRYGTMEALKAIFEVLPIRSGKSKSIEYKGRTSENSIIDKAERQKEDVLYILVKDNVESVIQPKKLAHKQITDIANLKDNWNENGASTFSVKLVDRVSRIVDDLPVVPFVSPTAVGAIQIEYEKEDGSYLEFEIYEGKAVQFMVNVNGEESEREITGKSANRIIQQAVVDFYG